MPADDGSLTDIIGILSVLVLVLANGFFVASEFSLVALRRSRISELVASGHRRAARLQRAHQDLDLNLASCQLGITISSLALGWIGEPALARLIEPALAGLFGSWATIGAHGIAITIAFATITVLHIVLGELAPKSLALQRSERTALAIVYPLAAFTLVFKPAILLLNGLGNRALRLVGLEPATEHDAIHSPDEIRLLVAETEKAGFLDRAQRQAVERVMGVARREITDLMTPRADVIWADADADQAKIMRAIRECQHEHIVLSRGTVDEIVGVVRKQDLLDQLLENRPFDPIATAQSPLVLPDTLPVLLAFERFRLERARFAIVVDEYGQLQGVVTRTDLLEAIAGEIPESDQQPGAVEENDGSFVIDGRLSVDEALIRLQIRQRPAGDFHTMAGFAISLLRKIPRVGDHFAWEGWRYRVTEMDRQRITKILATRIAH